METRQTDRKSASASGRRSGSSVKSRTAAPHKSSQVRKKRVQEPSKPVQEVVYLPVKPFQRNRLIMQLMTVAAVVVALVLGVSVFFKVDAEKTLISGCDKYTAADILAASDIRDGDNLLTFNRAQIAGKIIDRLPYVESVRVGIKLPDTVKLEIVEIKVPYAVKAQNDAWYLIGSGGKVIGDAKGEEVNSTKLLGVQLDSPKSGQNAVALENAPVQTDPDGNIIPVAVTQAQRLNKALQIVQLLELNGIIGKAASVDVNDLSDIQIWYGQQYQVKLGDDAKLEYKISCLKYVVEELDSYQSGVLDISFTTWPNQVGYTPFESAETSFLQINAEN